MPRFSKFSLLLVIAMLAVAASPVFAQGGPVTYNSNQSDPDPREFDQMLVQMWNEANPDTPVLHSTVSHEDFKQALRAYLVADPAPDVLTWFAGNRMNFFAQRDLLYNISDVWTENNFEELFPAGLQAASQVDGEYYFLPGWYYWWGVYYRPSLFEQAGIEGEPQNWEELLGACDALNEQGIVPITIGTKYRWTAAGWFDYLNMRINGPEFHIDLMLLEESYTDERVMAVFDAWNELFEHNCFIEDPAAYSWQEALDFMVQGDAAMYLIGDFVRDSYPDDQEDDLDFFQFPVIISCRRSQRNKSPIG
jgi:ABC-type glycerol-3-phosphate transport system substrate-binding protein